ncbi:MAG: DUF6261 family protein [Bacteroidales bacterium]|nr:DUF6261 family protein [Bacteroidales bacterium]
MIKVSKILTTTRVSEVNGLLNQMTDEYKKGDYSSDTYLTAAFERMIDENDLLMIAIMRDSIESELADMDEITDNEMTLTHGLLKGYTCHPDEAIAEAAEFVFKMVDKYGLDVKHKSYREQYPLLGSMIQESQNEPHVSYIAKLSGCEMRLKLLKQAVDNFNEKQNAYNLLKDDRREQQSASDIKKQLVSFINEDLITYLEVMAKVNSETYGNLAQFIANRINESNAVVRSRRNK